MSADETKEKEVGLFYDLPASDYELIDKKYAIKIGLGVTVRELRSQIVREEGRWAWWNLKAQMGVVMILGKMMGYTMKIPEANEPYLHVVFHNRRVKEFHSLKRKKLLEAV